MTTLTIIYRGSTKVQKIDVPSQNAVLIAPDNSGTVEMAASGANVLIRFGSPDADARDFIVVHDGDRQTVKGLPPVYARAFTDRPLDDY